MVPTYMLMVIVFGPMAIGAANRAGWSYARGDMVGHWLAYVIAIACLFTSLAGTWMLALQVN